MVEDESNLAFLKQCGVDYGQGWLFGKPSFDITEFEPKSAIAAAKPAAPSVAAPAPRAPAQASAVPPAAASMAARTVGRQA